MSSDNSDSGSDTEFVMKGPPSAKAQQLAAKAANSVTDSNDVNLENLPDPVNGEAPPGFRGREVFLAGLPFDLDEKELKDSFAESCGPVVSFTPIGRGGMGTLVFETEEGARSSFQFHATLWAGREIKVLPPKKVEKKEESEASKRYSGWGPGERPEGCMKLRLSNLGFHTSEEDIRNFFEEAGEIVDMYVPKKREDASANIGFAIVTFKTDEGVTAAANLNGQLLGPRMVDIKYDLGKPKRENGNNSGFVKNRNNFSHDRGKNFDFGARRLAAKQNKKE